MFFVRGGAYMDAITLMKSRRSIRRYEPRPVPREALLEILDCARLAPSGYNLQHWRFVCVTDAAVKGRIAAAALYGRFINEAGACIAVLGERDAECLVEDCCAATENIIIAAQAFGLGTCWVNSLRKEHSADVKRILEVPEGYELVSLITVGYPAECPTAAKKTLDEVTRWEKF